jgi:hypothetical protein
MHTNTFIWNKLIAMFTGQTSIIDTNMVGMEISSFVYELSLDLNTRKFHAGFGRLILITFQSYCLQCINRPFPHFFLRKAHIQWAETDVLPESRREKLIIWILEDKPYLTSHCT